MVDIKRQHAIILESENFKVEVNVDFEADDFGLSVTSPYTKYRRLHLGEDTAKELIELLQAGLKELKGNSETKKN